MRWTHHPRICFHFTNTQKLFLKAKLISVLPEYLPNGDKVITKQSLIPHLNDDPIIDALIIRTIPNDERKLFENYSNTNPVYVSKNAVEYLLEKKNATSYFRYTKY